MLENPPDLPSGSVAGRFVSVSVGTLGEAASVPDAFALRGAIVFSPLSALRHVGTPEPMTVEQRPVKVPLDDQGYLRHRSNERRGVVLPAGRWEVLSRFTNTRHQRRYQIEVTEDHTEESPLDLTLAAPIILPPAAVEVVTEENRLRAEASAGRAEQSANESADYSVDARTAADEAMAARDATLGKSIVVDTRAGQTVTVGGVLVGYEAGTRRLDAEILTEEGWANAEVHLSRSLNTVTLNCENLQRDESGSGWTTLVRLPAGFRPTATRRAWGKSFRDRNFQVWADGRVQVQSPVPDSDYVGTTFVTADAPPTTLPGTPG